MYTKHTQKTNKQTNSLRNKRFIASSSTKLGREQKKREWRGRGRCSRSNSRAVVTRLETLATQANKQRVDKRRESEFLET